MAYLLRKLGLLLFTAWVALTINFLLPRLVPGDPVGTMIAQAQGKLGVEAARALRLAYGLDAERTGLLAQYLKYLSDLAHGDFGRSLSFFPAPVLSVVGSAAPWTIGLVGVSTVLAALLGSALGLYSAWRRGTPVADGAVPFALFLNSMPYFWVALLALYVFAYKLGWFPLGGGYDIAYSPKDGWPYWSSVLTRAALPGLTIVLTAAGGWLVAMRNNAVAVMNEDFVAFGRAKGLSEGQVLSAYVARNALLPSLTGFALAIGFVIGGSLLTEKVFSYPGLGSLLYQSVIALDYPLMQAIFLFIALSVLVANFLVDLAYVLLDPRVRAEKAA